MIYNIRVLESDSLIQMERRSELRAFGPSRAARSAESTCLSVSPPFATHSSMLKERLKKERLILNIS